ncbi:MULTISPECIES: hypothetical protein [Novosphingobium]|jgi:hypothetical protein|uniref:DUF2946 family protein n=1 Tax=Novosphingobium panipatense TaxID=428991 RepID=A0ABY1QMI1_9SPHN|nr:MULTISPECIES: hypothetical protein [Novosphingobium]SMP75559.1 hypothetical protein SAMN06296065_10887 [Novosphingobium panipatense]
METLRTFFRQHNALAFALIAIALCLKIIVPSGYMVAQDTRTITVQICHDASGEGPDLKIAVPMKASQNEVPGKPAKGECPYGALSMVSLGGAHPVLLALAMAFIMALGFAPIRFALAEHISNLRPPLRGPPVLI